MSSSTNLTLGQYFKNIQNAALSTLEGMAVTFSWLFRRPITIQWPDKIEKPLEETLPERTRGILEVETRICTGCLACQKACPIDTISIDMERNAETKERFIARFDIDAAKCMYCGLCVDACPTGAIRHTTLFAYATDNIDNLLLSYVDKGEKVTPFRPKDPQPELRARGSIGKNVLERNLKSKN
ncbi:MAG: hypothetical protein A2504_07930 [Bdellovibrionales bacterium RIFOXYD12_FULL_39_22]|nr:MAG: hypothetical protein A2385_13555 [Bdellovibrionales bacterium RIFOXYB1_FULL_39_21]OFZ44859.1 MAG: hypothetical protein A2485_14765 [Bdellovibrionales bacterium RIFOXYC12_FULL_39_17]OFZ49377.1 MAG: hypothetical protein A2404_09100 [Bdellovibrionales bacterium RIFOXYC1_FULL_39_130]OFZ77098.1 MAG: hypothetical protein A2560_10750 [Bdellovibrionales bacterium RIFOXYD1_FULL_39_84]OFZ95559.1 MAG: hypothetical protein A2504_07930 [Bdellovibrionales bacterium RIFOXYD12_FULL_39_22]